MPMPDARRPLTALAVVQKIYGSVADGDLVSAAMLVAPEFVAIQASALPFAGTWRGTDGFAAMGAAIYTAWPDFAVVPQRFFADDDVVLVLARVRGAGGKLDQPMIESWRVADGRAVECRPFYFDAAAAAATSTGG